MITDVQICNIALSHLQAGSIETLDDNTANAKACLTHFDAMRDQVLADYPWQFATFIEVPELIVDEVLIGWSYLYKKPLKCMAIRKLFTDASTNDPEPIDFEECLSPQTLVPAIAVNFPDPYLKYTRQVIDPKIWSVKFGEVLALRLAATIGMRLTGKETLATELLNRYGAAISEAKRQDGQTKKVEKRRHSSYEDAR